MSPDRTTPERVLSLKERIALFLQQLEGKKISLAEGKETKIVLKKSPAGSDVDLEFEGYPGSVPRDDSEEALAQTNYIALELSFDSIEIPIARVSHPDLLKGGAFVQALELIAQNFPAKVSLEMEIVHTGTVRSTQLLMEKVRQGTVDENRVKEILLKNKVVGILTKAGFNKLRFSFSEHSQVDLKAKKDPTIKEIQVELRGLPLDEDTDPESNN